MPELKYKDTTEKIIGASFEVHKAQILNYLKAYRLEVGLLINFGCKSQPLRGSFYKNVIREILKSVQIRDSDKL